MSVVAFLSTLALVRPARAVDASYLHAGDRILWVGDSITAQNIYEPQVMNVLHALYPDAKLTDVNAGVGGATAPSRFNGIPELIAKERPTLMTVMFGVNDTGWGAGDGDAKIARYTEGLQKYIDAAGKVGIPVLFIHETHFSHNQKAAPLEIGLDDVLLRLFAAEDKLAADNHVPVIDGYGAYTRELQRAWKVDPLYEFTPNFVHPTYLGHAALAVEILEALGAGLPLARPGKRGPLHLEHAQPVALSVQQVGPSVVQAYGQPIRVHVADALTHPVEGFVYVIADGRQNASRVKLLQGQSVDIEFCIVPRFEGRWTQEPIYLCFTSDDGFAAAETPLFMSKLIPATADKPFTHDANGWVGWEGRDPHATTVSDLKVVLGKEQLHAEFTWKDSTPVHARNEPYKNRAGEPVDGPLDLTSPFGQPCDAVELLLDLRDAQSTGRYTANMDSLPKGTARVGLYQIEENGKLQSRLQVSPAAMTDRFHLKELGNDRYAVDYAGPLPDSGVGFNAIVSDAKEYKPNQQSGSWMSSVPNLGHDWTDFPRLTSGNEGVFVRVGY